MGRPKAACVLNRAPLLFGTGGDFRDVCAQAIGIGAVDTIEALDEVQVPEVAAIEYKVV
jgi:hypothetical protein